MLFCGQRLGDSQSRRVPAIGLGIQGLVGPGRLHVLHLVSGRSHVLFVLCKPLLRSGVVVNAAGTAGIGHVIGIGDNASLHNRPVDVGRVDDGLIHMHNRGVVGKVPAPPLAAGKADAAVAEAVVHSPVVAHMPAPVALMEPIMAVFPAPIVGRPQRAFIRRRHPRAGHPVVVSIVI
jgi:hypothetical protein